jgi:hypothetical protein
VKEPKVAAILLSLVSTIGCGGMTAAMPTGPSQAFASSQAASSLPPDAPTGPAALVVRGVVKPVTVPGERCYFNLYACQAYNFSLAADGGVDVTLTWEGGARDLMIQLYRADVGLIHEDVAPRGGTSQIYFRRPDLASMDYQLRVVSLQQDAAVPFTLTYTPFEN